MYNSGILDYYLMWIINVEMYMDKLHFIVNPVAGGTRAIDKFGAVKGMLDDMRFPYTYESVSYTHLTLPTILRV